MNEHGPRRSIRWEGVCIDCADAEEMAAFYCRILGWEVALRDTPETSQGGSGWILLRNPSGGIGLSFQAEEWYAAGHPFCLCVADQ